jgi:hypothetical protein
MTTRLSVQILVVVAVAVLLLALDVPGLATAPILGVVAAAAVVIPARWGKRNDAA